MKKIIVSLVIVLLVFGLLLLGFGSDGKEPRERPKFKTVDVSRGEMTVKISATGVVEPNFKVEVKSKASGEVLSFPFEEGDFVKKNTLMLQLDKSDELRNVSRAQADLQSSIAEWNKAKTSLLLQQTKYNTDLQSAKSAVEAAQANLKESEDKLNRQIDLFNKQYASQEALDEARTTFKVNQEELIQAQAKVQVALNSKHDIAVKENEIELAKAEMKRSEIALEETQERLEETDVFAPISGVIIQKLVEEGQIISSGISTVTGGTPLSVVADMSHLFIIADVDETDIGRVKENQDVVITADAFPDKSFQGKVRRIAPQGAVENNITVFKVKIEIVKSGKNVLKPMMTANVDIVTDYLPEAIYIPREGLRKEGNQFFAAVLKNDTPEEIPVTPGIKNQIHVQVVSGLEPGEKLVLGNWRELRSEENKSSTLRRILWMIRKK